MKPMSSCPRWHLNWDIRHLQTKKVFVSPVRTMVHYNVTGMTCAGSRNRNEDAYVAIKIADICLLAVADGVGGEANGDRAAQIAIETLTKLITGTYRKGMGEEDIQNLFISAFAEADRRIRTAAAGMDRMGTTLVAAIVRGDHAYLANCGDSRAFVAGKEITFRTREHSLIGTLVRMGSLDPAVARNHPLKNVLTHALGIDSCVDIYSETIPSGSALILCSDGLSDEVARRILAKEENTGSEDMARALLQGGTATSDDDVTVVVLESPHFNRPETSRQGVRPRSQAGE